MRLPPVAETDRAGVVASLSTNGVVDPETVRVVRTADTMHLYRMYASTALGKTIMANRPREEVEAILDRHGLPQVTDSTITDREELFDVLEEVRARGYAYDDEERVKGMRCVAAPITDEDGYAIAAVSVSGPKSRMREQRFTEEVPEQILRSANVVEVNLTYS